MKIAISAKGPDLDSRVDLMLGRCEYVLVVDPETQAFEVLKHESANPDENPEDQGARMIVEAGVEALISGNISSNSSEILEAGGVKIYPSISGSVRQILDRYAQGQLEP